MPPTETPDALDLAGALFDIHTKARLIKEKVLEQGSPELTQHHQDLIRQAAEILTWIDRQQSIALMRQEAESRRQETTDAP